MLDKRTAHVKVQEQCDCFATADPLAEMAGLRGEPDAVEGALKWIALAVLHGIGRNAESISIGRSRGKFSVTAKYRETELPAPPERVGREIFDAVGALTHIEGKTGKTGVVIGIRDGSVEIGFEIDREGDEEKVVLSFPKL